MKTYDNWLIKSQNEKQGEPEGHTQYMPQQSLQEIMKDLKAKLLANSKELNVLIKQKDKTRLKSHISSVISLNYGFIPRESFELLQKRLYDEITGLGPIQPFLDDSEVTEIMVNNAKEIYIEKKGKTIFTAVQFESEDALKTTIDRIVQPLGKNIDESNPIVDARLPEGHRVNATLYPISIRGHTLTIRKHPMSTLSAEDLIAWDCAPTFIFDFLKMLVVASKNIVISGGTNSGKTTLLNVASQYIPHANERVAVVEDSSELKLSVPGTLYFEVRQPNAEGIGAVPMSFIIKNCLRISPTRIVVGECRREEAIEMLQAMNTGHDGSMTTGHSNSPRDMLSRFEYMCQNIDINSLRKQIVAAIHVIVQVIKHRRSGKRQIVEISELVGLDENDDYILRPIFKQKYPLRSGESDCIKWTGYIPTFFDDLEAPPEYWESFRAVPATYAPKYNEDPVSKIRDIELMGKITEITVPERIKIKLKNQMDVICLMSACLAKTERAYLDFLGIGDEIVVCGVPSTEDDRLLHECHIRYRNLYK